MAPAGLFSYTEMKGSALQNFKTEDIMATFSNQATLTYSGGVASSNIVKGEVLATVSVTKTAVGDTYTAGDTLTYVVTVTNSGTTAMTGLTLTDDLGAYAFGEGTLVPLDYVDGTVLYYVGGVLQPTPTVDTADGLAISGISVPAGGNATVIYGTTANGYAPLSAGSTVTNTVTLSGGGITPVTATATVTADSAAALSISKSLSPEVVNENGTLTYTFVIENEGGGTAKATDDVVLSDTFSPILSGIAVTLDGAPLAETTGYTYNETTGEFATVAGVITVPAATYTQDAETGLWAVDPGTTVVTVSGTV